MKQKQRTDSSWGKMAGFCIEHLTRAEENHWGEIIESDVYPLSSDRIMYASIPTQRAMLKAESQCFTQQRHRYEPFEDPWSDFSALIMVFHNWSANIAQWA